MIPKSMPLDLIRGWEPAFGKDHAPREIRKRGDPPGGDETGRVGDIGAGVGGEARRWQLNCHRQLGRGQNHKGSSGKSIFLAGTVTAATTAAGSARRGARPLNSIAESSYCGLLP